MSTGTLHVLNTQGDVTIGWDADDPASVAKARQEVEALRLAGFQFFLVDGSPADEVAAGRGRLSARRVEAEELLPPEPQGETAAAASDQEETPKRGRGRPRGNTTAVATRPLQGG